MDVAAAVARPDRRPSLQSIDREHHLTPTRAQVRAPRILVVLTLLQVALYVAVGHRWTALCWGLVLVTYEAPPVEDLGTEGPFRRGRARS